MVSEWRLRLTSHRGLDSYRTVRALDEAIAESLLVHDQSRVVWVVFDLLSQSPNGREQRLLVRTAVPTVLRFEKQLIGNDAPDIADEKRQDFKFCRRQFDRFAAAFDDVGKDVDFQGSKLVDRLLAFGLQPRRSTERTRASNSPVRKGFST